MNNVALNVNVVELNRLAVTKLEQVVNLNLASLNEYAELVLGNLKAGLEVSDAESLKSYTEAQAELVRKVSEKALSDAKALAAVGTEYNAEARSLVEAGLKQAA